MIHECGIITSIFKKGLGMSETTTVPEESVTKSYYKTVDQRMLESGVLITNAIDPEILAIMTHFGYNAAAVKVGETLRTLAVAEINTCQKELSESRGASETAQQMMDEVHDRYMPRLKLCRVLFANDTAIQTLLELNGRRKKSVSGALSQARMFYDAALANPQILAQMATLSMSEDLLKEDRQVVVEAEKALIAEKKETGEALTATVKRDAVLERLFDWVGRYKDVAKVALAGYPRYMEKLGIKDQMN